MPFLESGGGCNFLRVVADAISVSVPLVSTLLFIMLLCNTFSFSILILIL